MSLAGERFERRLAEEGSGLRVQIPHTEAGLRSAIAQLEINVRLGEELGRVEGRLAGGLLADGGSDRVRGRQQPLRAAQVVLPVLDRPGRHDVCDQSPRCYESSADPADDAIDAGIAADKAEILIDPASLQLVSSAPPSSSEMSRSHSGGILPPTDAALDRVIDDMRRLLIALLLVPVALSAQPRAKNVILFLADAGGLSTLAAASLHGYGAPRRLYIQRMPHIGLSDTSTATQIVTDSAAGMTAIVTGREDAQRRDLAIRHRGAEEGRRRAAEEHPRIRRGARAGDRRDHQRRRDRRDARGDLREGKRPRPHRRDLPADLQADASATAST